MRGTHRWWLVGVLAVVWGGSLWFPRNLYAQVSFQELEESLTCQCGCGLTVHSCNHVDCGSAIPLRKEIREQMSLGKTKEEILAYFEAKYGEKILSSPVARGFNWFAWVTPFVALGVGGILILWTVHRWSSRPRRHASPETESPVPLEPMSSGERDRLQAELDRFDA